MTKYPLKAFLRVCKIREEQAQRELSKARLATQAARDALQQAQKNYEEYKMFRPQQEKKLFAQIQGQNISQKRLDAFHIDIQELVNKELDLANLVNKAKDYLEQMQKQEEEAQKHWVDATKEHSKIQEHEKIWKKEQKILEERAEEAEMEQA